ncbi:MAG: DUF2723 domain-containing protein [Candidatus Levybacteria bacterium]|nr:DUF2723 domain-containing protein [Candidatus Levybacteria bacterium]
MPIYRAIPIALFVCVLALYLHNLSPSVYGGDVGDLVTSAVILGVPHPPGYPLFTVLGNLLVHIGPFFHMTPAYMVGVVSALSGALAVFVYFILIQKLTRSTLISLISSLTLATSFLFWFYAEIAEVFELNNFFAISLLALSYFYRAKGRIVYLYALSFVAGLSLTNHHTIIFVFPGVLLMIGTQLWRDFRLHKRILLYVIICTLVGFSVYFYPFLASSKRPHVDWGNVTDLQSFLDLLLRKKYGTFQLALFHGVTLEARLVVFKTYLITLLTQLTIPVVFFCILGFASLLKKEKVVALSFFLSFLISGPVFILYAGFYLSNSFYFGIYERFLSISSLILLLFFPFGVLMFTKALLRFFTKKEYLYLFQAIFLLIPIMLFSYNFPKTNLSQLTSGDDLGKNYLAVLPKNSLLFLSGDTNLFNTWYIRYALNFRKDTEVFNGLGPEKVVERYGKSYGYTKRSEFFPLLEKMDKDHQIFSDIRFSDKTLSGKWVPYGLYYEYRSKDEKTLSFEEFLERTEKIWSLMKLPSVSEMYANALVVTGNYFLSEYENLDLAMTYYKKALAVDQQYAKAYATIGALYLTNKKNCIDAIPNLRKAIDLYQFDKKYYLLLALSYDDCNASKEAKDQLSQTFKKYFGVSLSDSIKQYNKEEK